MYFNSRVTGTVQETNHLQVRNLMVSRDILNNFELNIFDTPKIVTTNFHDFDTSNKMRNT